MFTKDKRFDETTEVKEVSEITWKEIQSKGENPLRM